MDALSYPIFTFISAFVRAEFILVMDRAFADISRHVLFLAALVETIFLIYFGFLIAFKKSAGGVRTPNLRSFIYHLCTFAFMIGFIKSGTQILDLIFSVRNLLSHGLTGSNDPAGQQAANQLDLIYAAFVVLNALQSVTTPYESSSELKQTSLLLGLAADVSPQIMGSVVILLNEMLIRICMALSPLMIYLAFYDSTRSSFTNWFKRMIGLTIQMSMLAVVLSLAVKVTIVFSAAFAAFLLLGRSNINAKFFISELQESVIQAGFGFILTTLIVWFPTNAGSFSSSLYNVTMRTVLGDRAGVKSKMMVKK